ncbi:MAG: EscU/YscU/HrcU family type III secretion system export apparatus switch protein [bacterium]|nr:EscU/YscU/HrcU family type III secretion system export apparatus switch protein [bacterium]
MSQEKQHKPSQKKIRNEREKGNVAKASLITQCFSYVGCILGMVAVISWSWERIELLIECTLSREGIADPITALKSWANLGVYLIGTSLFVAALASGLIDFFQVGPLFCINLISFDLSRLNPASGFKRINEGLRQIPGFIFRLLFCVWVFFIFLREDVIKLVTHFVLNGEVSLIFMYELLKSGFFVSSIVLLIVSLIELGFKRRKFLKDISMSWDEVKRENKEENGCPEIKGHRNALHHEILTQDFIKRVRSSNVVVVDKA